MSLTAAMRAYVVFLLLIQVVQGQYNWGVTYTSSDICAPEGSAVVLSCSYKHPSMTNGQQLTVQESFWYKVKYGASGDLMTDSEYRGRVTYRCQEKTCNLTITDLRQSDSAQYKFRFTTNQPGGTYTGYPGVTLTVTDLKVQVEAVSTQAKLECTSSCHVTDNLSYVWLKNGQKLSEKSSSLTVPANISRYSCAVGGHEVHRSPEVCEFTSYAPKPLNVSVNPSGEVLEGDAVTLTCSSDANPAANYSWYKKTGKPDPKPGPQLVFSSIQPSDSGEYFCRAENSLGETPSEDICMDVKYAPKDPSVSSDSSAEIMEESSVTLTCSSDANPVANFTWYKKNKDSDSQPFSKGAQLVFSSIQSSDSGEFYCEAENQLGKRRSEPFILDVKYAPKVPLVSSDSSAEIVEESSVTLTCSSDANPVANFTWYKKNKDSDSQPFSKGAQLVFSSIQSSDSGEFYCEAENQLGKRRSEPFILDVKVMKSRHSLTTMNIFRLILVLLVLIPLCFLILTVW
ncbi:B-cell receptor CD22-like [Xyrichtys novacula]|uniref:B-cell receptor CD22 n=1 Tax=Xyrichtys novacula TaxID=13765 RepID=A0AAV1EZD1_XYRNO|nr:B-cell receptor CD22-like [Xyrichtys novacula]